MKLIAFDIEANGLINPDVPPEYQPAIIELGAIHTDDKETYTLYSQLINPEHPISKEVQGITHITDEDVANSPTFRLAFPSFAQFFTGADILITFNGPGYDLPVLMYNLIKHNLQYQFPWPRKHVDLMQVSSDYLGMAGKTGNKPPKLIELYKALFDEEIVDAHRAINDAKATMRCALELEKRKILSLSN